MGQQTGDDLSVGGSFYDARNDFIGPWWEDNHRLPHYAHRQRVVWSPQVCIVSQFEVWNNPVLLYILRDIVIQAFVRNGVFQRVVDEIQRSRSINCRHCHQVEWYM